MAEIFKRFKTVTCNLQDPEGEWVSYKYYRQEVDRLKEENALISEVFVKAFFASTRGYKGLEHIVYIEKEVYDEVLEMLKMFKEVLNGVEREIIQEERPCCT